MSPGFQPFTKKCEINEESNIKYRTTHILFAFLLFTQIVNTALDGDPGESDILYLSEGILFIPVKR